MAPDTTLRMNEYRVRRCAGRHKLDSELQMACGLSQQGVLCSKRNDAGSNGYGVVEVLEAEAAARGRSKPPQNESGRAGRPVISFNLIGPDAASAIDMFHYLTA
jgi:hypothetical protein